MKQKILIVEDNRKLADLFNEALSQRFMADVVHSVRDAHYAIKQGYSGYLLDLQLPDGEGISLIPAIMRRSQDSVVIVVTAYGTVQKAVDALKLGAADFLEKPVDLEALLQRFLDLIPAGGISSSSGDLICNSPVMKELMALADQVASTPFPVLITGETGVGKEVLARYIHSRSGRDKMITLNCASLPEQLADSILFGHTRGSFTGAVEGRKGLVEAADRGTLFLDEIGELPLDLQAKLLRFLDSGAFMPIGCNTEKRSSARIVAATNRNLQDLVRQGGFRQDLYYRLSTFPMEIPPLRRRPEDIEPLARHHLKGLRGLLGMELCLDSDGVDILKQYDFPGNVRELFNVLDRVAVVAKGRIGASVLERFILSGGSSCMDTGNASGTADFWTESRASAMEKERELIKRALEENRYNKAATARSLKVSYKTLLNKMKKLGL